MVIREYVELQRIAFANESQTLLKNLTQLILHGDEIKQVIVKVTENN